MAQDYVLSTAEKDTELNTGMKLISKPRIYVDESVHEIFKAIAREIHSEFSFFYKIKEQKGWDFYIDSAGFLPKQRANSSHIEYDESRPSFEYRCVIHRHPNNCNTFSKDDNDAINLNFDVSLIWTASGGFVRGQLNILDEKDCTQRIVMDAEVTVLYDTPEWVYPMLERIKPFAPVKIEPITNYKQLPEKTPYTTHWTDSYVPEEEGKPINYNEGQAEIFDIPTINHEYAQEVVDKCTTTELLREDELIDKIMTYTQRPVSFKEIMLRIDAMYSKLPFYADFENLMYSLAHIALQMKITPTTVMTMIKSGAFRWRNGQYDIVLRTVISLEEDFMRSQIFADIKENFVKGDAKK